MHIIVKDPLTIVNDNDLITVSELMMYALSTLHDSNNDLPTIFAFSSQDFTHLNIKLSTNKDDDSIINCTLVPCDSNRTPWLNEYTLNTSMYEKRKAEIINDYDIQIKDHKAKFSILGDETLKPFIEFCIKSRDFEIKSLITDESLYSCKKAKALNVGDYDSFVILSRLFENGSQLVN